MQFAKTLQLAVKVACAINFLSEKDAFELLNLPDDVSKQRLAEVLATVNNRMSTRKDGGEAWRDIGVTFVPNQPEIHHGFTRANVSIEQFHGVYRIGFEVAESAFDHTQPMRFYRLSVLRASRHSPYGERVLYDAYDNGVQQTLVTSPLTSAQPDIVMGKLVHAMHRVMTDGRKDLSPRFDEEGYDFLDLIGYTIRNY